MCRYLCFYEWHIQFWLIWDNFKDDIRSIESLKNVINLHREVPLGLIRAVLHDLVKVKCHLSSLQTNEFSYFNERFLWKMIILSSTLNFQTIIFIAVRSPLLYFI